MTHKRFQALNGPHTQVELPKGHRVFAIGDIHGRLDLLLELLNTINQEISVLPKDHNTIIFLGDYVDRGPDSAGVVEHLSKLSIPGAESIFLMGNHEKYVMDLTTLSVPYEIWLQNGGGATLKSYGIDADPENDLQNAQAVQEALKQAIPQDHWDFFEGLKLSWRKGSVFFAHAGIDPSRPLDQQRGQDLMWIREPFLNSERNHGALIVHGHTPHYEPEVRRNRINVDTTAWQSNYLTALVLETGQCRFLST